MLERAQRLLLNADERYAKFKKGAPLSFLFNHASLITLLKYAGRQDLLWRDIAGKEDMGPDHPVLRVLLFAQHVHKVFDKEWPEPEEPQPIENAGDLPDGERIAHERHVHDYRRAKRIRDTKYQIAQKWFVRQATLAWPGRKDDARPEVQVSLPDAILPEDYPRYAKTLRWYLSDVKESKDVLSDLKGETLHSLQVKYNQAFPSRVTSQHLQDCDNRFVNIPIPDHTAPQERHPLLNVTTHAEILGTGIMHDGKRTWTLRQINSKQAAMAYGNPSGTVNGSSLCFTWDGEREDENQYSAYRSGLWMLAADDGSESYFIDLTDSSTHLDENAIIKNMDDEPVNLYDTLDRFLGSEEAIAKGIPVLLESLMHVARAVEDYSDWEEQFENIKYVIRNTQNTMFAWKEETGEHLEKLILNMAAGGFQVSAYFEEARRGWAAPQWHPMLVETMPQVLDLHASALRAYSAMSRDSDYVDDEEITKLVRLSRSERYMEYTVENGAIMGRLLKEALKFRLENLSAILIYNMRSVPEWAPFMISEIKAGINNLRTGEHVEMIGDVLDSLHDNTDHAMKKKNKTWLPVIEDFVTPLIPGLLKGAIMGPNKEGFVHLATRIMKNKTYRDAALPYLREHAHVFIDGVARYDNDDKGIWFARMNAIPEMRDLVTKALPGVIDTLSNGIIWSRQLGDLILAVRQSGNTDWIAASTKGVNEVLMSYVSHSAPESGDSERLEHLLSCSKQVDAWDAAYTAATVSMIRRRIVTNDLNDMETVDETVLNLFNLGLLSEACTKAMQPLILEYFPRHIKTCLSTSSKNLNRFYKAIRIVKEMGEEDQAWSVEAGKAIFPRAVMTMINFRDDLEKEKIFIEIESLPGWRQAAVDYIGTDAWEKEDRHMKNMYRKHLAHRGWIKMPAQPHTIGPAPKRPNGPN